MGLVQWNRSRGGGGSLYIALTGSTHGDCSSAQNVSFVCVTRRTTQGSSVICLVPDILDLQVGGGEYN